MTFIKVLFLLLILLPFAVFLLFIIDKLMDELPGKSRQLIAEEEKEYRRNKTACLKNSNGKKENGKQNRIVNRKRKQRRKNKKAKHE